MATIFDFLQDIIAKKKGDLLNDIDNESALSPYMLQRWLSMYSIGYNSILNNTSNRLYPAIQTKQQWYKLFLTLIPKTRFKRIYYIRKTKEKETEDKKDNKQVIEFLAKQQKLSQREVADYIQMIGLDVKDLKKKL